MMRLPGLHDIGQHVPARVRRAGLAVIRRLQRHAWVRRNTRLLAGIGIGIVLALVVSAGWEAARDWWFFRGWEERMARRLQPPHFPTHTAVTYDWTITTLNGEERSMRDLRGKVVVVNFWATWCGPCRAEMPSLQRLYEAVRDDGVELVCISDEAPETVQQFVEEHGYTFPIYTLEGERPDDFQGRGIPATFILSKEGQIAFRHLGSAKWDDPTSIDFITSLL